MTIISYRDTWVDISLDDIFHNASTFKKNLIDGCRLMAVVKADGYGHGSVEVAKTALEAGADYLGVAFLDEALVLRSNGINSPILILGYTPPESIETAIKNNITITVYTEAVLYKIISLSVQHKIQTKVHLKIDTGMGRVGVTTKEDALHLASIAQKSEYISLEGIFTHFADADSPDPFYTNKQFEKFTSIYQYLDESGISIPIKHCCNSAGTINFPTMHLDMVRVGISLYGLQPSAYVKSDAYPLKQAMHFKTKVSALKTVSKGQALSYGCTFKTENESTIATLPVGYADGLSRSLSNKGQVLLNNKRVPIVGRVCMDQTMLDVSQINVCIGDEVTLFGGSKDGFISIDEVARLMGTINYEVVCLIGKRVPRVYSRNQQVTTYNNLLLD